MPALFDGLFGMVAQRQRRPPIRDAQRQRRALIVRQVAPAQLVFLDPEQGVFAVGCVDRDSLSSLERSAVSRSRTRSRIRSRRDLARL
jgi:hypothetical protein